MKTFSAFLLSSLLITATSCDGPAESRAATAEVKKADPGVPAEAAKAGLHFRGALKGGMKGDSIFFDVSADGKRLENLTFKGYWYCDGKLERQDAAGPEGHFDLVDGKVNSHISEPPNGGATAWRFDLDATIEGKKASGTFRMNINALRCNTGTLSWEAVGE